MSLEGRVALITGASSGIGRATAAALAERGVRLVLTGRRAERLDELAARLDGCATLAADILDPALPPRLLDLALERFGRLDIVFNNAGENVSGPIEKIDIEGMCRMVRVNVEAAFRLAYTALRHFRATGAGHLINTGSVLGTKVRANAGPYAGTKYAIEALSEALRLELARSAIKVTCIEPGLVDTEIGRHAAVPPAVAMNIARPLQADDIARAVLFVLDQPAHVAIPRIMLLPQDQEV